MEGESAAGGRRSDRKRAEIVAAAERQFLEFGYGAASMDRIAADAGASKRTVYNHFPSKPDLFRAVVRTLYAGLLEGAAAPPPGAPAGQALEGFAQAFLRHLASPRVQALIRLIIAENQRFPEITAIYFQEGKEPALSGLGAWLAGEAAARRLAIDDPTLAALQFLGCIKEGVFWPRLLGVETLRPPELVVREAVATFLARYAPS